MSCISTMVNSNTEKKLNPVYGLSWSPNSLEMVTVHLNGDVILWDCEKSRLISSIKPGGGSPIYRVEYNKLKPDLIASGSSEGFA